MQLQPTLRFWTSSVSPLYLYLSHPWSRTHPQLPRNVNVLPLRIELGRDGAMIKKEISYSSKAEI